MQHRCNHLCAVIMGGCSFDMDTCLAQIGRSLQHLVLMAWCILNCGNFPGGGPLLCRMHAATWWW